MERLFTRASSLARILAAIVTLFCLTIGDAADAAEFEATTLLFVRPTPVGGLADGEIRTEVPLYELLHLVVRDDENPVFADARAYVSLWGRMDTSDLRSGSWADGDVNLAFIEGKAFKRRLLLRIGRQLLLAGVSRPVQIDGLRATVSMPRGFGLTAFGGIPVESRFTEVPGDWLWGGRLFWRHKLRTEIGASFAHVLDEGKLARLDVGLDARWAPHANLALTASGLFAVAAKRLGEAHVAATWRPNPKLQMSLRYAHSAPEVLLPATSLYTVFSDANRHEVGAAIVVRPFSRLRIRGDYHLVLLPEGDGELEIDGLGHRAALRVSLAIGPAGATTVGVEGRMMLLPVNGYVNARAFARHRFDFGLLLAADAAVYLFQEPINDTGFSFTATGTVGYQHSPTWQVLLSGLAGVTPFYERRFDTYLKIVLNPGGHRSTR